MDYDVISCTLASSPFGMDSFVSDHSGFSGEIKLSCKDFQVTEIDLHGNKVCLDGTYSIPPVPTVDGQSGSTNQHEKSDDSSKKLKDNQLLKDGLHNKVFNQRTDGSQSCNNVAQQTVTSDSVTSGVPKSDRIGEGGVRMEQTHDKGPRERLCEILGDDLVERLTLFAKSEYDLNKYNTDGRSDVLSIGVIASKETRTEIHKRVKYIFPHLCTKVQKPSGEDGLDITVHSDPIYWEFFKCLAANQIDDFIRFVDAKDASKTFKLSISGGKEERTKLHRLVARHYGSFLETKTFVTTSEDGEDETRHDVIVRYRQKFVQRAKEGGRGQKRKFAEQETVFTGKQSCSTSSRHHLFQVDMLAMLLTMVME